MNTYLEYLGRKTLNRFAELGRAARMLFGAVVAMPKLEKSFPLFVRQVYKIGFQSLLIICISGVFVGMVLALQAYIVLVRFSAEETLGTMVALSLFRELGPTVTALLFAGRAGSALTAEIGLMKATEQLSSLEMMAINPLRYVIAPRFWAGIVSLPILTIVFVAVGLWGAQLVGVEWKGIDHGTYWSNLESVIQWQQDVFNCIVKSVCFAFVIMWIALAKGLDSHPNPEGISKATTSMVILSSLTVLGLDFFLTVLMFGY